MYKPSRISGDSSKEYGGLSFEGAKFESIDDIKVGDEVVVYGKLKLFNTTYEVDANNILISKKSNSTGIPNITVTTADNAPAYNLAGQKVNGSYKGILIKNGKKMVKK